MHPPFEGPPRDWLKLYLSRARITYQQLADKAGLNTGTIDKLINDPTRRGRSSTWFAIAKAIDLPQERHQAFVEYQRASPELTGGLPKGDAEDGEEEGEEQENAWQEEPGAKLNIAESAPQTGDAGKPRDSVRRPSRGLTRRELGIMLVALAIILALVGIIVRLIYGDPTPNIAQILAPLGVPVGSRCAGQSDNDPAQWVQGESADSACNVQDGAITIDAGGRTILDADGQRAPTAPMLFRRVSGDFEASVRMAYDGGIEKCRNAGLGVRAPGSATTWLRIVKDGYSYRILSEGLIGGRTKRAGILDPDMPVIQNPIVDLRIIRRGDDIEVGYRIPGEPWQTYWIYQDSPLGQQADIFLTVHAACDNKGISATFTDFVISPLAK